MSITLSATGAPPGATGPAPAGADPEARRAAQEFEAVFLTQVVEEMMSTVDIGSFGRGEAEDMWRGILAQSVADEIAAQGRTGIAQSVEGTIAAYRGGMRNGDGQ